MNPDLKRLLRFQWFRSQRQPHGSAQYMGFWERLFFLSPQHRGFIVGKTRWGRTQRLSQQESEKNLLLVAPTGMYKTSSFIIENVLRCSGSVVTTDPSGEIFTKTSGHMADRGYQVLVFNPTDLSHSIRFNVLQAFRQDHQSLKQIATILARHNSGPQDQFWVTQASNILYLVMAALTDQEDTHYRNLANVRWVLNHLGGHHKTIDQWMKSHLTPPLQAEYQAFIQQDSRVLLNTLSTARAALDLWSDPQIAALTADHTLDLNAFRQRKTILYLIVPEHRVAYFSLLMNLTFSALFETCIENAHTLWGPTQQPGEAVYFFMDEFTNACGEILNFPHTITVSRKRRMPIAMIIQDLSQLNATYGPNHAQTIYGGGCGNKLFYGGLEGEACRKVATTLGTTTETIIDHGKPRKLAVPLLRSEDLRQLYEDEYVLLNTNNPPIKGKKQPYFMNRRLLGRTVQVPYSTKKNIQLQQVEYLEISTAT